MDMFCRNGSGVK